MNEISLQSNIIEWIKGEGGYGRKLSHRFLVGIPDLLLRVNPPRSARGFLVVAEVKILHSEKAPAGSWSPKIGITQKQLLELGRFEHSCIIVGITVQKKLAMLVVMKNHQERLGKGITLLVENNKIKSSLTEAIMETVYV
jgi:hypothetical protein